MRGLFIVTQSVSLLPYFPHAKSSLIIATILLSMYAITQQKVDVITSETE